MGPTGGGWVDPLAGLGRFGLGHLHVNSNVYPSLVPRDGRAGKSCESFGWGTARSCAGLPAYVVVAVTRRWAIAAIIATSVQRLGFAYLTRLPQV